jgi:hypothetical protein
MTKVGRDSIEAGTAGTGKGFEFHQSNRREPLMKNFAEEDISYVPKSAAQKA